MNTSTKEGYNMENRYRTKEEMIQYFKQLAWDFATQAHRNNDLIAQGESEAYELAAFELEHNME